MSLEYIESEHTQMDSIFLLLDDIIIQTCENFVEWRDVYEVWVFSFALGKMALSNPFVIR